MEYPILPLSVLLFLIGVAFWFSVIVLSGTKGLFKQDLQQPKLSFNKVLLIGIFIILLSSAILIITILANLMEN